MKVQSAPLGKSSNEHFKVEYFTGPSKAALGVHRVSKVSEGSVLSRSLSSEGLGDPVAVLVGGGVVAGTCLAECSLVSSGLDHDDIRENSSGDGVGGGFDRVELLADGVRTVAFRSSWCGCRSRFFILCVDSQCKSRQLAATLVESTRRRTHGALSAFGLSRLANYTRSAPHVH